jgi:hypothetical protein
MKSPKYLSKNRHGIYYFRVRISKDLQHVFSNKSEIKISLKTDSQREAVKIARSFRVEFDKIADEIVTKKTIPDSTRSTRAEIEALEVFAINPVTVIEGEYPYTDRNGEEKTVTGKIERVLQSGKIPT